MICSHTNGVITHGLIYGLITHPHIDIMVPSSGSDGMVHRKNKEWVFEQKKVIGVMLNTLLELLYLGELSFLIELGIPFPDPPCCPPLNLFQFVSMLLEAAYYHIYPRWASG